jgi:hypothetical protein
MILIKNKLNISQRNTWESRPSVRSIKKKVTAQNGPPGIIDNACGYATKAKPGPAFATWSTGKPVLYDIKPRIEKTAKPANTYINLSFRDDHRASRSSLTDVKQSQAVTIIQSLKIESI